MIVRNKKRSKRLQKKLDKNSVTIKCGERFFIDKQKFLDNLLSLTNNWPISSPQSHHPSSEN